VKFKVDDIVVCKSNVLARDILTVGQEYEVAGFGPHGNLSLKGVRGWWDPSRFELVRAKAETNPFKPGDWVVCEVPFAGRLKKGRIYRVSKADGYVVSLHDVLSGVLGTQVWNVNRFSLFVPFKPGDIVECIDTDGASMFVSKGQKYEVSRTDDSILGEPGVFLKEVGGGTYPHFAWRFKKVDEVVQPHNDLATLKAMLDRAGTKYRTWNIGEWVDRNDALVKGEAIVLVFGAEGDGPYTEFIFHRNGAIIKDGAKSFYTRITEYEVA
jgi:hypothetical protein